MIRPLDMFVTLNAMPDYARQIQMDQASVAYRQMQNLSGVRERNITAPSTVPVAAARPEMQLQNPDQFGPDIKKAGYRDYTAERSRSKRERGEESALRLYGSVTKSLARGDYSRFSGDFIDFSV